jgi:hypothetical protein
VSQFKLRHYRYSWPRIMRDINWDNLRVKAANLSGRERNSIQSCEEVWSEWIAHSELRLSRVLMLSICELILLLFCRRGQRGAPRILPRIKTRR